MDIRYALAYSLRDPVGSTVAKLLREEVGASNSSCTLAGECYLLDNGIMLGGFDVESYQLELLDRSPDPGADVVIVLSRHSASSGKPSLTTHHTGNPTSRTLGGDPYQLSVAAPPVSKALLTTYKKYAEEYNLLDKYSVTLEATHHGPTRPRKPLVFIEVGSTPEQWRDSRALEAMMRTVVEIISQSEIPGCKVAVGYGEPHYPIKFTKMHLETEYCFGHIIPRYAMPEVNEKVLLDAVMKNWPAPADVAIIHKKSVKSDLRRKLINLLEQNNIEIHMV